MSIIFNSADIAKTMNNGVSNVTSADSIITENYTNVVQHGIKIDVSVREKTLSGTPPLTFNSNGTPLLDFLISGDMVLSGTPTPSSPIQPSECGDLETSGEKAGQYKIPISSANTTTPVYLGEVETTRYIKKYIFDGTENWEIDTTNNIFFYVNRLVDNVRQINGFCTHFRYFVVTSSNTSNGVCATSNGAVRLRYSEYNTVDDFKSFLAAQYAAGTPVTIWYILATPETGIVNEPLRKIGDYADTLSMEQAGVSIPTAVGNNTVNVQTTPKPSDMTIKYKGR